MKHILTLTDYSSIAESAVESAFIFAQKYHADLTIFHNVQENEMISYALDGTEDFSQYSLKNPMYKIPLERWKHLAEKYEVKARYLVGNTNLLKSISDIVDHNRIDLIVMGSTGAGGKEEYVWGSNTEKVVKNVDCPVLVIKRPIRDYRIDNIVFASSFDMREKSVLKYALELLNPPSDATVHLLSINTSSFYSQPSILIKEAMKDFEVIVYPLKVKSHFYHDYSIDAGIRHFMDEVRPDILIMNSKHRNPWKRIWGGNNTIKAINHSEYPVLSVDYKDEERDD